MGDFDAGRAVAGREPDFSLVLCRLSGRGKGSSRRGGMSYSRVSGKTIVAGVDRRADAGRDSEGSEDSSAGFTGLIVPEDQSSVECDCPTIVGSPLSTVL